MPAETVLVLMPPSPPFTNVMRDYAGGFGVSLRSHRPDWGHDGGSAPYISALYAAAILARDGREVQFLDCQAEELSASEALTRVRQMAPGIIISAISLPSLESDLRFLELSGDAAGGAGIVAVGTVCKALYGEILRSGAVSAAVMGDAEVVIPDLVGAISEGRALESVTGIAWAEAGRGIHVTGDSEPLADLDSLPMPPYQRMPMSRYYEPSWGPEHSYMAVLDGRGCPHKCGTYCPYPFGFGTKPLHRAPGLVVDEMEYLHREFGTEAFLFRSQTFTINRPHVEAICAEIIRRQLRIRWLCETRLDSVDTELLALMASAGCDRVHYGLESGDARLFEAVGKPGCDLAQLGGVVEATRRAGMIAKLNVVIGLPGENRRTVRETVRTVRQINPDVVMAALITPYPGTRLFESAKRDGLLLTEDWSRYTGFSPVMRTHDMSGDDLLRAKHAVEMCLDRTSVPGRAVRRGLRLARDLMSSVGTFVPRDRRHDCTTFSEHGRL